MSSQSLTNGIYIGMQYKLYEVLGNKCAGHHNLKTVKIREIMLKYTENSFLHIKATESCSIE